MDVREQLRTAPPGPTPSDDDAQRTFQRGRRRVVRRRVAGAGAALAVVLVAVAVAVPFGTPGSPIVEDEVTGAPDATTPDPDDERETPDDDPVDATPPQTVQVGQVVLTVPEGVTLTRAGTGQEPCYAEATEATLVVMEALLPDEPTDCPDGSVTETTVVAAPASAVPPMFLPGHAVEDTSGLADVDLLGTTGVVEEGALPGETPLETYLFTELDLYLLVVAPDEAPGVAEELLASASRAETPEEVDDADGGDSGSNEDHQSGAPPLEDEASTEDRQEPADGPAELELVDIRVGTHDGFDRVTLEFAGDGQVGWFMDLGDEALEDGSGREVPVDGEAVLNVAVNAMAFPPDLPDSAVDWNGVRIPAPAGAGVLTEVVGSIWFEAQQQVFIGLEEAVAYRVVRFDGDPQRLAIDLVHP